MYHHMKLQLKPFEKICSGTKQIEIRLFDEKRQQLKIGDVITVTKMDDESKNVQTRIINLIRFDSYKNLFGAYNPALYGGENRDEYESMYQYYSREEEQEYGVLAIHLQVI